ncbi:hypothetical protein EOL96_03270 [Candidatus Saccharibacteria bacterium]|nr:hypothetical protein [Candidatus Saccharibacteria bacterium]
MGRYLEQTESRSELQQRIAAELRAKAAAKAKQEGADAQNYYSSPDGVDDSAYVKGTKSTTTLAPIWLVVFFIAIGVFVYFVYLVNNK